MQKFNGNLYNIIHNIRWGSNSIIQYVILDENGDELQWNSSLVTSASWIWNDVEVSMETNNTYNYIGEQYGIYSISFIMHDGTLITSSDYSIENYSS